MSAPSGTFLTSAAIGNREDLTDMIYRITPTVTPTLNMAAKAKATNTIHEWQTQDLASAASNAQAEGDDATNKTVTPTVRLANRTQISAKTVQVAGTQEAMNSAGRKSEMAYQMSLSALELKRDMELGLTQNDVISATATRQSRGLRGWVVDNKSSGTGYTAPSVYTGTGTTATVDGTQRTFTETLLKDVLQQVFTAGGDPNVVMMGPALKQTFSSFSGNSTRFDKGEDQKLFASIDVYVSDFGELKAVPNRLMRTREAFVLQTDKLAIAYLRPFQTNDLARTGDSDRKQMLVEYTLECKAPKAHGAVYDLS